MVITRSKRAKRVLRCLSISQHQDELLSPSTTPLIRYTLLNNFHRCRQVSIDLAEPADPVLNTVSYNALPKFLRSQLEAQKITNGGRLWSQIVPILTFIQANLRKFGNSRGFPTLFFWYSRENHRSYFFFAFVENKMPSKTYTSRELLRMRQTPTGRELYEELQERLQKDLELGEIFRMPLDRSLPLIKEEPAEMSGDLDSYTRAKNDVSRQLDGTDSEWKYRGRSEEEHAETQPISAPPGLIAQKDEGFQRFYKAVVSPTHVRVTAGGRIVPNTRGSSSPTAKWLKEKVAVDGTFSSRPPSRDLPEQGHFPMPQAFPAFPPMFPGFAPGMVPGMPAGPAPFPMMPWQMGLNLGGAFGMVPHPLGQATGPTTAPQNSSKTDKPEDTASDSATPVRTSPPEQFDPARPFFYNGQWMMPPGAPFYPYPMPPAHGFPAPPMFPAAMAAHRFGPIPMIHPHVPRPGQATQPQLPGMFPSMLPPAPGLMAPIKPPISSIRPSEITKKQIDMLRGSLRYFEDQIQYNKHQIDEKSMEQQAQVVRQQIQQFEKNLEAQLAFEESHYPKQETKNEPSNLATTENVRSQSPITVDTEAGHGSDGASSPPYESSVVKASDSKPAKERGPFQYTNGSGVDKPTSATTDTSSSDHQDVLKKPSTLPVAAALAPPFQPRITSEKLKQTSNETFTTASRPCPYGTANDHLNETGIAGEPYLVGTLPSGINMALVKDTDYVYPRELTGDELRARHMYWGKTPYHLQSGLPKFDGKDFYPPSPARNHVSELPLNNGNHLVTLKSNDEPESTIAATESDPFQPSIKLGRGLAGSRLDKSAPSEAPIETKQVAVEVATVKLSTQPTGCDSLRKGLSACRGGSATGVLKVESGSDDSDENDDKNLLFKGRNSLRLNKTKTRNGIWQSMMKQGMSSGNVVPGTVSSMTACGVLPHYRGHATASLAPAAVHTTCASKPGSNRDGSPVAEKQVENRPPGDTKLASRAAFPKVTPTV